MRFQFGKASGARIATGFVLLLLSLAPSGPAGAGGWAVTTLDPIPAISAGVTVPVGFTVLQHGDRPIDLDAVSMRILRSGDSPDQAVRFEAQQRGSTGHYIVDVRFPEPGRYSWSIDQGWFGPQELGTIDIKSKTANGSDQFTTRTSAYLRFGSIVVGGLVVLYWIVQFVLLRRRALEKRVLPRVIAIAIGVGLITVSWQKMPLRTETANAAQLSKENGVDLFNGRREKTDHRAR